VAPAGSLTSIFLHILSFFCLFEQMYVCFVCRPGSQFVARFFCARFGSEPDKRNASVRRGPGGFFNIHFAKKIEHFLFLSKNGLSLRLPLGDLSFLGFAAFAL